jgi:hypothetical protein
VRMLVRESPVAFPIPVWIRWAHEHD